MAQPVFIPFCSGHVIATQIGDYRKFQTDRGFPIDEAHVSAMEYEAMQRFKERD